MERVRRSEPSAGARLRCPEGVARGLRGVGVSETPHCKMGWMGLVGIGKTGHETDLVILTS